MFLHFIMRMENFTQFKYTEIDKPRMLSPLFKMKHTRISRFCCLMCPWNATAFHLFFNVGRTEDLKRRQKCCDKLEPRIGRKYAKTHGTIWSPGAYLRHRPSLTLHNITCLHLNIWTWPQILRWKYKRNTQGWGNAAANKWTCCTIL